MKLNQNLHFVFVAILTLSFSSSALAQKNSAASDSEMKATAVTGHYSHKSSKSGKSYYLFSKDVPLKNSDQTKTIYFFGKDQVSAKGGEPLSAVPENKIVSEKKSGIPILKNKAGRKKSSASKKKDATQKGIGTIDQYDAHGKIVYRFVPAGSEAKQSKGKKKSKKSQEEKEASLRLIKFIPGRIGFKKGLPEELEKFFATALKEKKEVEIECEFADKGAGKTSYATKLVSYKFAVNKNKVLEAKKSK